MRSVRSWTGLVRPQSVYIRKNNRHICIVRIRIIQNIIYLDMCYSYMVPVTKKRVELSLEPCFNLDVKRYVLIYDNRHGSLL